MRQFPITARRQARPTERALSLRRLESSAGMRKERTSSFCTTFGWAFGCVARSYALPFSVVRRRYAALELDLFLSLELQEFPAHLLVLQLQGREPR
jgi:hypothetical protein